VDLDRQRLAPVRHETAVITVEAGKVHKVEAVGLGTAEVLEVAGDAGVPGIADAVDDVRPREHGRNDTEVQEVGGHLVGDARGGGGETAEVVQVFAFDAIHGCAGEGRRRGEERDTARAAADDVEDREIDRAEFTGAEGSGVGRDDLLDEAGAGARHANDENAPL
jgi:hypothetical protein